MRNSVYILLLLLGCLFTGSSLYAQDNKIIETTMRSNDKIYVVMAVCLTILVGLILYLVNIDRKIARIEDKQ